MANRYFTCAKTATLVRQALRESFPGIKFAVKSHTYSMGATINVSWDDGPTELEVEQVTRHFHAGRYGDYDDAKKSVIHIFDGEEVHWGSDRVHVSRYHSDAVVAEVIDALYSQHKDLFELHSVDKPTVEQYRSNRLWSVQIVPEGENLSNLHEVISKALYRFSKVEGIKPSALLDRIQLAGAEGKEGGNHAV